MWLIPAHAGKTFSRLRWALWRRAHPRSRGENVRLELTRPALRGSSPLTRGKPTRSPTTLKKRGLIPAHAGKTPTDSSLIGLYGAHPRSRGENEAFAALLGSPLGSSPLTRGKQTSRGDEVYTLRLIPAHAGKTGAATPILTGGGAHPRSRGENHPRARSGLAQRGSSPLTRGKLRSAATARIKAGLIPAHAGKTHVRGPQADGAEAHPRSRGENRSLLRERPGGCGSSPLTRGKLISVVRVSPTPRLIPAHAGKTAFAAPGCNGDGAHPRSRGENTGEYSAYTFHDGSSPLTRGKRRSSPSRSRRLWLIPAHAGKTYWLSTLTY